MLHLLIAALTRTITVTVNFTVFGGVRGGAGTVNTETPNGGIVVASGTPVGGTYQWVFVSGDNTITPIQPNDASSVFTTTVTAGQSKEAVYRCQYTNGATAFSEGVLIQLQSSG
jgi:hypothetical protein